MGFWKPVYTSIEGWGVITNSLNQHQQLLDFGGQLCKVLFKNRQGVEIGVLEAPIPVISWDTTSTSPRKIIWKDGDDKALYPDPNHLKILVDGVELSQTFSSETIRSNSEFYVDIIHNSIDSPDYVAFYLNPGFNISGKNISYYYETIGRNVVLQTMQPKEDADNYRTQYGYTQYASATSSFRGNIVPNTILVSFPPNPALDTRYMNTGAQEEWRNRTWTIGDVILHENDIIYRVSDSRWYEIVNWEPNWLFYKTSWKLLTQSFDVVQLGPNDITKQFPII